MYVDTEQGSETSDPLSLDSLITWLEQQPANGGYDYACALECVVARWLKSIDPRSHANWPRQYQYTVNGATWSMDAFRNIAAGKCRPEDWTYGEALKRAREQRAAA